MEFNDKFGIKSVNTSPYHPQSNSSAESYNRNIIKYMRAMLKDDKTNEWHKKLKEMSLAYNTHLHQTIKTTPFALTFTFPAKLPYRFKPKATSTPMANVVNEIKMKDNESFLDYSLNCIMLLPIGVIWWLIYLLLISYNFIVYEEVYNSIKKLLLLYIIWTCTHANACDLIYAN